MYIVRGLAAGAGPLGSDILMASLEAAACRGYEAEASPRRDPAGADPCSAEVHRRQAGGARHACWAPHTGWTIGRLPRRARFRRCRAHEARQWPAADCPSMFAAPTCWSN